MYWVLYLQIVVCRNKFIKLLNEEQNSILKKLAKFVYLANEKRTFILHNVADLSTLS